MNDKFTTPFGCRIPVPPKTNGQESAGPSNPPSTGPTTPPVSEGPSNPTPPATATSRVFLPDHSRQNPSDVRERYRATATANPTPTATRIFLPDHPRQNPCYRAPPRPDKFITLLGCRIPVPAKTNGQESAGSSNPPSTGPTTPPISLGPSNPTPPATTTSRVFLTGHRRQNPSTATATATRLFLPDHRRENSFYRAPRRPAPPPSATAAVDTTLTLFSNVSAMSKFRTEVDPTFLGLNLPYTGNRYARNSNKNNNGDDNDLHRLINCLMQALRDRKKNSKRPRLPPTPKVDLTPKFLEVLKPDRPVFLHRKLLSEADVDKDLDGLVVRDMERLDYFFIDQEIAMSTIKVVAVDKNGREHNLRLSKGEGGTG